MTHLSRSLSLVAFFPADARILIEYVAQATEIPKEISQKGSPDSGQTIYVFKSRSQAEHVNDLGDKQTIDWYLGAALAESQTLSHCLESPGKIREKEFALPLCFQFSLLAFWGLGLKFFRVF